MDATSSTALAARPDVNELITELENAADALEQESRRRGWGSGSGEICVFPAQQLLDTLLDLRSLTTTGTPLATCIDSGIAEHAQRPGASTTSEVKDLCGKLRLTLT